MVPFLAKVKLFRFWPKTMDYNKAFLPKSRRYSAVLLLITGRCYEAEICAILFLLRCPFIWYPFWPKSNFSDFGQKPWTIYNKAFLPKSRRYSAVLLLITGRCYEAEICAILFLLRCPFIWYPFWPKSNFSDFGQKPWTIYNKAFLPKSRRYSAVLLLITGRCYEAEICAILFLLRCPFIWYPFWPKSNFGQKPWTIIRRFYRNQGDFLWSFYSTVEGATKLKSVPFCSS